MKSYEEVYKELERHEDTAQFRRYVAEAVEAVSRVEKCHKTIQRGMALVIRSMQEDGVWKSDLPVTEESVGRMAGDIAEHLSDKPGEIMYKIRTALALPEYDKGDSIRFGDRCAEGYAEDYPSEISSAYHELFDD